MWFRLSNKNHGFIHQIANKESRTRVYNNMFKDSAEDNRPTDTSRKEPRRATSSQDQHPEDAIAHDHCVHYWTPKTCASSTDFTQWLIDNREDRALRVSISVAVITRRCGSCLIRIFDVVCLITCWHAFKGNHTPVMSMTSPIQIATLLSLIKTEFMNTRPSGSCLQHMMHIEWKSRLTLVAKQISWSCLMRTTMKGSQHFRTGTHESSAYITLWFDEGSLELQSSRPPHGWTSFLFDGLGWTLLTGRVVGEHSGCIRLAFSLTPMHMGQHLAF